MCIRIQSSIGFLFLLICLGGNSAAQAPDSNVNQKAAAETQSAAGRGIAATTDQEYRIGPQDVLQIDVWKEAEITRTIPVRPDGKISLPLLNDVQAAGLTAMELAGHLREGLSKYLNNPQVTVIVTQINSQRIFVNGEVGRPGALPLLPGMTGLQALSSSGGFTLFAKIKGIYILRNQNGKQVKIPYDYKAVQKGAKDDIMLLPGDIIVVP